VNKIAAVMAASLVLAAGSGALVAVAVGASSPPAPQKTVTVNIPTGTTGPQGPPGPAGPPGPSGFDCPSGFVPGILVIDHPQGQATIYTCISSSSR
jgi:hypothetical protein